MVTSVLSLAVAVSLAIPAAGAVGLTTAAAAPGTSLATAAATTQWTGKLKKAERADSFRVAGGGATVEFAACDALRVTYRPAGGPRQSVVGSSPLTVGAQATADTAKVTITKPKADRRCATTWSAETSFAATSYKRRPKPQPTTSPTPTASPTPTPTTASPTPAPTAASPTPAPTTATPAPTTASPTPAPTTASPTPAPTTASPTPTTASPMPTTSAPTGPVIRPEQYGATGDGVTDDTSALKSAINALTSGATLLLDAGKTYRHTAVLKVVQAGSTIAGSGTLLATSEATSALHLAANNITVDGPTLKMGATTQRWVAFEQMKLRLGRFTGITVRNVLIDGSAAAGIYVGGASNFRLADVTVRNTRADAIHMTGGANFGTVDNARVINPGDDGVAVVSYKNDGEQVHDITVNNPWLEGQVWGRAFSVVGGYDVTYNNVTATRSAGACIYIAAESEFNSYGVNNVAVNGGTLTGCNQQADVDTADRPSPAKGRVVHGAVMVYNSQPAEHISNVTMRNLTIKDTHLDGYDQVKLNNTSTGTITRQEFRTVAITGGSRYLFKATGVPTTGYRTIGWTKEGVAQADRIGW